MQTKTKKSYEKLEQWMITQDNDNIVACMLFSVEDRRL